MTTPSLIAIDWGSSNFRAYLTDQDANVIDSRSSGCGMLHVHDGDFPSVLEHQVGEWLIQHPDIPILMSGMVGSRQGWVEANYLKCPVKLSELVGSLTKVDFSSMHTTYIVPGLCVDNDDAADVMRGEETQLFGALAMLESHCQIFCLPGTHSKWVEMSDGSVLDFRTYLSGEMFLLLSKYSMLSKQMSDQKEDQAAFEAALSRAQAPVSLLNDIFSLRAEMLLGHLPAASTRDALTGLLIGYEIMQSADFWDDAGPVALIAADSIVHQYAHAFRYYDIPVEVIDPTVATLAGLVSIAGAAGII